LANKDNHNHPESMSMDSAKALDIHASLLNETVQENRVETPIDYAEDFERLIDEHQGGLIRYAYRMVKNRELAQDMVQDAFIRYIKNPPKYGLPKQRASWLYRVTHNLCIDYMKRETKRKEIYEKVEKPKAAPMPMDEMMCSEGWGKMEHFLVQLSENQRSVMYLFFQQGKSYKEIEVITDLSLSNVGMLLHRGLKRLRKLMEEEGFSEA
jgi:RNA polymerase sigma-70 factor (ECF subfamily)